MQMYHLAVDIGASSGLHILGCVEDGRIVLEEGKNQLSYPKRVYNDVSVNRHHKRKNFSHGHNTTDEPVWLRRVQAWNG